VTTLLVVTAGHSDVQLVVDNQRRKFDGNICGTLHDEIRGRTWVVVDAPQLRDRGFVKDLPDGDLAVCTPKLDAILRNFGDAPPTSALIFETTRHDARDPRLSGVILERRLRDHGVNQVTRVAFLTDTQQLEDPTVPLDAVVRRAVVDTLSNAIASEVKRLSKDGRVFVATTGGLAAANEVINELVRLHSVGGPSVTALEVPDRDRVQQDDRAVEETFHPAAGVRARWHALSLVEKGNLLGAWGAVNHLEGAPGQEWTQVVKWLAHFASSLPLPADCDLSVLRHKHLAVRSALRVELALRAGDIPRAVHGTVAFFEAALWDGLNERIERSPDPKRRRYYRIKNGDAPSGNKLLRQGVDSDDNRKCPFELKETIDRVAWYWIYDGDGGPAARLAKHFLKREGLVFLDKALGSKIRDLRNDVAHNEPTPELMDDARRQMQEAALWSTSDTFLSQPLVVDVLRELGESEPGTLLDNLEAEVRRRLVSPAAITPAA
jgi:hypothetical protein